MLPAPSTYSRRYDRHSSTLIDWKFLVSRSRATNLAVIGLSATLILSVLLNIRHLLFSNPSVQVWRKRILAAENHIPGSLTNTITRDGTMSHITHLVMVAGHAVWRGCDPANRLDEGDWLLEERQKGGGNVEAFFNHIKRGAEIIVADPNSLLIFSGGQTRPSSLTTEAQSYHRLAIESHLLGRPGLTNDTSPSNRVFSENYALDSYQNLLFSLARFREVTGSYPARITVVGFGMKKQRFEELHRRAIRWPKQRFHYIGIDVKGDTSASYQGEAVYGFTPYSRDIYGCHDELLAKRRRRNPFHTFHPYHVSAPEMADLIEWCPEGKRNMLFSGPLPWDYL